MHGRIVIPEEMRLYLFHWYKFANQFSSIMFHAGRADGPARTSTPVRRTRGELQPSSLYEEDEYDADSDSESDCDGDCLLSLDEDVGLDQLHIDSDLDEEAPDLVADELESK